MIQINSGKYRGKKLLMPSKDTTRTTKSIVKDSVFNTLQFDIVGSIFVEVFGGSGSMGLEAISRGSKKAYFIEKDKKSFDVLRTNCNSIDKENTYPMHGDSFKLLPTLFDVLENDKCYFYVDPPFDIRDGMENIYDDIFNLIASIPSLKVKNIIIEHISSYKIPEKIGNFEVTKTKKFGNTTLTYLK